MSTRSAIWWLAASLGFGVFASADAAGRAQSADARQVVDVRLTYARPLLFESVAGRPTGFEVIADYRSSETASEYQGTWNETTQTLTANVRLPVGSENLVYVVDEVVPPFMPTPIAANRQVRLREVECPRVVTTVQVCYGLTVTGAK